MSSINAAGWIAGGLLYRFALRRMTTRALLKLSIVSSVLGTLGFLSMIGEATIS